MAANWLLGGGAAVIALISLIRFLLDNKRAERVGESASSNQQTEIVGLREDLRLERADRRADITTLNEQRARDRAEFAEQIAMLKAEAAEQRTEKHRLNNELTKAHLLLGVIVDLAEKCTCGALDLVSDLMARAVDFDDPQWKPPS